MKTTTNQNMKIMGNDVIQKQEQTFHFSWKTTEVKGDKATIEQEIKGVVMSIEIGGSTIKYNSFTDSTANNPLGDFFKALVGSKFIVVLDTKKLEVDSVGGREDFIKKLVVANQQMKPLLEQILSPEALKEMAAPTFAVIDTKPVGKGDKWVRKTTLNMGPIGSYANTYNYEYVSAEKDLHKIKVDALLEYKVPGDATAGAGGLPFKIKSAKLASKTLSGEVLFDSAKGRLAKSTLKMELKWLYSWIMPMLLIKI